MNLRHVLSFVAVADAGSIRGAARRMGITQPAVTKSIQQLESSLRATLITRNVTGVTLTPYGVMFLERARLIASELGRAREELAQLTGAFEGTVSVALAPSVGELVAPRVISAFQKRHPAVLLRINGGLPTSTIHRVCDGTLDFVIGPRPADNVPSIIDSWPLHTMDVAITVRKNHRLSKAKSLIDFASVAWILTRSASGPSAPLAQAFNQLGLARPVCMLQSDSLVATQAHVAATDYAGLMPRQSIEQGAMRNLLTPVEVPELTITNSVELFFRKDTPLTPAALELAQTFRQAALSSERL